MGLKENKYFWLLQLTGWGFIGLVNYGFQVYSGGLPTWILAFNALGLPVGGILVSSVFRSVCMKINWIKWKKGKLSVFVFFSAISLTLIWIFLVSVAARFIISKTITLNDILANIFPLAMIMLIWCLLYFGYHLVRHYHFSEIEKWRLKAEINKAQLDVLKLQINPHFIFNTLNNIRALILEDQNRARKMLTNFSDLFRYSLQNAEKKEVAIFEELKMVNFYMELVKIQYEERLKYEIIVGKDLENELIPPMIIQMLAENAIKHGIAHSLLTENNIYISILKDVDILKIIVKNNGTLENSDSLAYSEGIGLKNIESRLFLLYGERAAVDLKSDNSFVEAIIKIKR